MDSRGDCQTMTTSPQDRRLMFAQLYENYLKSEIDQTISPSDTMMNQWYFPVGLSAAQVVYAACLCSWVGEVKAILDLPCGHGRVLRHLTKLFPGAKLDACDLDKEGVEFCERQFNARGIVSNEDLLQVDFAHEPRTD
jgi:cyclopropane fatty-acyl-phospholipid synthase-like methyltransferase